MIDYQELVKQIKEEFPDKAIDIMESLELLRVVINDRGEILKQLDKANIDIGFETFNEIGFELETDKSEDIER